MIKSNIKKEGIDSRDKQAMTISDKILSAAFYLCTSLLLLILDKYLLNYYDFQYFELLTFCQYTMTVLVLIALIFLNKIEVPSMDLERESFPISFMIIVNAIKGLGGEYLIHLI